MDSNDLLAREKEFRKLNEELEKKTESLMKEINCAMQDKDSFAEFSNNLTPSNGQSKKVKAQKLAKISPRTQPKQAEWVPNSNVPISNIVIENAPRSAIELRQVDAIAARARVEEYEELEYFYAFVKSCVEDGVLPHSLLKDNATIEDVCKFMSAKIKQLQEQKEKLMGVIDKRAKQCESHMNGLAKLEEERLGLLNKANNLKSETADMKAKYGVMQNKLNEKNDLYKEERRIADKLTGELRQLKAKAVNLEARCASQEQLINNLKQQVEAARIAEKEYKASARALSDSRVAAIRDLEVRLCNICAAIKKQDRLIENLRAQNSTLVSKHALVALEKEYNDFFIKNT